MYTTFRKFVQFPFSSDRFYYYYYHHHHNHHQHYLLTPWSIVLFEKLSGFQLVEKFPAYYYYYYYY